MPYNNDRFRNGLVNTVRDYPGTGHPTREYPGRERPGRNHPGMYTQQSNRRVEEEDVYDTAISTHRVNETQRRYVTDEDAYRGDPTYQHDPAYQDGGSYEDYVQPNSTNIANKTAVMYNKGILLLIVLFCINYQTNMSIP